MLLRTHCEKTWHQLPLRFPGILSWPVSKRGHVGFQLSNVTIGKMAKSQRRRKGSRSSHGGLKRLAEERRLAPGVLLGLTEGKRS